MSGYSLPEPLARGARVRLVAPSGAVDRERFLQGVAIIAEAGLEPVYDEGIFARQRYLAGNDGRRADELLAALADPDAAAIWTARGGFGATRILARAATEKITAARKWLVGFSDTTVWHCAWARAGVASLHGANVTTLASWSAAAREELFGLLASPTPRCLAGAPLQGGSASGRLLGGNITVLAAMAGTGGLPSWEGAIVLLEDVGERAYRLDRALTQLKAAQAFAGVSGIVIGQLTGCDEPSGNLAALDVVGEVLAPLDVPIVAGLPVGHEASSRAVLLGVSAELDAERGELHVLSS